MSPSNMLIGSTSKMFVDSLLSHYTKNLGGKQGSSSFFINTK
jgi:hypothetical protein